MGFKNDVTDGFKYKNYWVNYTNHQFPTVEQKDSNMLKLVVLTIVLVVSVSAKPGYLGGGGYPAAVSHVSRVDFHAKPVVSAYSAPYYSGLGYGLGYGSGYGGSSYGHSAYGYGYPLAHSYANRVDLPGTPVAVGIVGTGYGHSGYGHAGYYGGLGYGYGGWDY